MATTAADTVTPWYADKGFLAVLIHMGAVAALAFFKVQLNEASVLGLVSTVITFVVAHKAKSGIALAALIKAEAAAKFTVPPAPADLGTNVQALDKPVGQ